MRLWNQDANNPAAAFAVHWRREVQPELSHWETEGSGGAKWFRFPILFCLSATLELHCLIHGLIPNIIAADWPWLLQMAPSATWTKICALLTSASQEYASGMDWWCVPIGHLTGALWNGVIRAKPDPMLRHSRLCTVQGPILLICAVARRGIT